MAIVFQYGSNMSSERLNAADRLHGNAQVLTVAVTKNLFDLRFSVWSYSNNCAAADLKADGSRYIYGVLYDVPDYLVSKDNANAKERRSLDEIEGPRYDRVSIDVVATDGTQFVAQTYLVANPRENLPTSFDYTSHIMRGIEEHALPAEYRKYVIERIRVSNPSVADRYSAS